jgi:4-amino-4-deoxy-L-arabinose transferase-like glycosyltransferase
MINRTIPFICLVLILLLAGFLRAWNLNENPPEMFVDEVFTYLSAKSFFEDGHILYQRLPVYGFASYLSASVLGESPLGIRMPAVLFGLVSILLVYLLAKELFGDMASALFSAFFMAIIPWHPLFPRGMGSGIFPPVYLIFRLSLYLRY